MKKKYLFGLGTMLVGAGLMFVFTHTEVNAESETNLPDAFVCSTDMYAKQTNKPSVFHCETKTLECAVGASVSCVKKGGIFK
jgi:NAD(P)H-hydrate repair Nnr-like enzyme with NAD(P)H-hydrate dehydratase domain